MMVTATNESGLWNGQIDGETVCGPYLNKGMAIRQANRVKRARVEARNSLPQGVTQDAATGALTGPQEALKALYREGEAGFDLDGVLKLI